VTLQQLVREQVVLEARSWKGTPYRLGQGLKGAGVDCARIIAEVFIACGIWQREDFGVFSHDWFQHTREEKYMFRLLRRATKTMEGASYVSTLADPGNIVLSKVAGSKVYNHGGIVTKWPYVIQAVFPDVNEVNVTSDPLWCPQQVVIFDPFRKPE
jgi:cell wall-associated NlpC family hydrolase